MSRLTIALPRWRANWSITSESGTKIVYVCDIVRADWQEGLCCSRIRLQAVGSYSGITRARLILSPLLLLWPPMTTLVTRCTWIISGHAVLMVVLRMSFD
jgi:hypothetical protein